jgi:hypothetical protein
VKLLVFLALVVGTAPACPQRLSSLPTGSRERVKAYELGEINRFAVRLIEEGEDSETEVLIHDCDSSFAYDRSMGPLDEAIRKKLNHNLAVYIVEGDERGVPPKETQNFLVDIQAFADYGPRLLPGGGCLPGLGTELHEQTPVFSFTKEAEGRFVIPPEATEFTIDYFKHYLGIQAPGVKWVEVACYLSYGGEQYVEKIVTRNGADASHWASQLYGNGIVYLQAGEMAGLLLEELWQFDPFAYETVTLYYDEEQSDYDRFDLLSGQLISSSAPRLAIGWYGSGLHVSVLGIPGRAYVLESSTGVTWPQTNVVAVLATDSGGRAYQFVRYEQPAAFFRAREAQGGEDSGAATPD